MTTVSAHLRVALTRGEVVESVHAVSLVVLDPDGGSFRTAGDPAAPVYGRSALKPAQAVAVLRAGADLTDDEVALAGASVAEVTAMRREDPSSTRRLSTSPPDSSTGGAAERMLPFARANRKWRFGPRGESGRRDRLRSRRPEWRNRQTRRT